MNQDRITKPAVREIVDDFAKEIDKQKRIGAKPTKTVINFRDEKRSGPERDVYLVPIASLRYRKDNGRISADILSYEKNHGKMNLHRLTAVVS